MTTPTPPDAVREALVGALMYGLLERDHTLANVLRVHVSEDVGLIRSAEQMADTLLARPSDARGREAVTFEGTVKALYSKDSTHRFGNEISVDSVAPSEVSQSFSAMAPHLRDWEGLLGFEFFFAVPDGHRYRITASILPPTAALSPTQEGANNG